MKTATLSFVVVAAGTTPKDRVAVFKVFHDHVLPLPRNAEDIKKQIPSASIEKKGSTAMDFGRPKTAFLADI